MNESYYGGLEDTKMYRVRISNLLGKIAGMLVLLLIVNSIAAGKTIHVKADGTGDGSSWAASYGNLRTALDNADPNDEIWVAAGMYRGSFYLYEERCGNLRRISGYRRP